MLASPVWRLIADYCKTDVLSSEMGLAVLLQDNEQTHGCFCQNLNIHSDLFCENAVLTLTGWLLVFNVTCHNCLGEAKIEHPGCSKVAYS